MKDDGANPGLLDAALDHELSHDGDMISEAESAPAPEYSDLLDTAWLTRDMGTADLDEGVLDEVGVMLDLGDLDDDDDAATALEFDVGSLLTSLAPESSGPWASRDSDVSSARDTSRSDREGLGGGGDESFDDAFALRALRDLLPQESAETDRGDEEVGDDERFPVFEPEHGLPGSREEDAGSDVELD